MAALRSLLIQEGHPIDLFDAPRVRRVLRAVSIAAPPPSRKLPITHDILIRIRAALRPGPDDIVFAAAMSLAFFGCLRAAELCVASPPFDPECHLRFSDLEFHSSGELRFAAVSVRRSKTDLSNLGFRVYIGCVDSPVCGYCALRRLRARRLLQHALPDDPLFSLSCGGALSKSVFIRATKSALSSAGLDPSSFSGHSFRAGAATSGADAGLSDYELQLLGRWSSDAYMRYVRAPPALLARLSFKLASGDCASSARQFPASSLFGAPAP